MPDVPVEEAGRSPGRYLPLPKLHPLPISVPVTLLWTASSVPEGDRPVIPARFRIFPDYDF